MIQCYTDLNKTINTITDDLDNLCKCLFDNSMVIKAQIPKSMNISSNKNKESLVAAFMKILI